MKLAEGDIQIDFTDAIDALIFDQSNSALPNFHGIGRMSRVDFIVELREAILFVELKDPGNPRATRMGLRRFYDKLNSGVLGESFYSKFVNTFFYRWAEKKIKKPLHYINLVTIADEETMPLSDEIAHKLPPTGLPVSRWERSVLENCQVFNLETWNSNFPKWPAMRISSKRALPK
jgi:hypothetical protein